MVFISTEEKYKSEICVILKNYGFSVISEKYASVGKNGIAVIIDSIDTIHGNAMLIIDNTCNIKEIESSVTVAADCDSKTVVSLLKNFGCITVSIGSSAINSISVSSINDNYALVSVQRTFLTKSGKYANLGEYRINTSKKADAFSLAAVLAALIYEEYF